MAGKMDKLNDIFKELGWGTIPERPSIEDAIMLAEDEGVVLVSKSPDMRDTCAGKLCYPTRNIANRVKINRMNKGSRKLVIYECDECKMFHLTSR